MTTTTFTVANVDRCTKKHTIDEKLSEHDLARWASKDEELLLENFQTNYPLAVELSGKNHRIKNAFIGTIYKAYCDHYPLELSVEDIWTAIAQGIGIHLNIHGEKYRSLMVSHEGQKELTLEADKLRISDSHRPTYGNKSVPAIDWPRAVRMICNLIKNDMKTDISTVLTSPFSSTTPIEQAVFDCTLMDTVKVYYKYRVHLMCGIPEVTLRGSAADFQDVIDRINQLRTIFTDFNWWLDSLLPHLEKMKQSVEGKPDIDWWQRICHLHGGGSGPSYLAGWLANFVPYTSETDGSYHRALRDLCHIDDTIITGIDFADFSESITQTDFILDNNGDEINMKLIAGFFGIGQNPDTGALRPCLGWATVIPKQKSTS